MHVYHASATGIRALATRKQGSVSTVSTIPTVIIVNCAKRATTEMQLTAVRTPACPVNVRSRPRTISPLDVRYPNMANFSRATANQATLENAVTDVTPASSESLSEQADRVNHAIVTTTTI